MRVLLDEHYSVQIAAELQNDGYDVVAVTGIHLQGIDDEPLLAFAAVEERALLTNNIRHFVPLAREWALAGRAHYGLILSADDALPRSRNTIGRFVLALRELMDAHPEAARFLNRVHWLT